MRPALLGARSIRDAIRSIPGCIGLYLGDEMSGTLARDLSFTDQGTYTAGYLHGAPTLTYGDPIPSTKYDGSTSYILVKSGFKMATLANSTIVAAVKTTAARDGGVSGLAIYCERASAGNDIWKLELGQHSTGDHVRFTHRDDAGTLSQKDSIQLPNGGKPHVVGFTKAATAVTFYFDGLADGTATLGGNDTFTNGSPEARIGSDKAASSVTWADWIGFVGLFNRTLAPGEMRAIAVTSLGL